MVQLFSRRWVQPATGITDLANKSCQKQDTRDSFSLIFRNPS
jgi:hypothetical protein